MKKGILEVLDNETLDNCTKEKMLFNYVKASGGREFYSIERGHQCDQYVINVEGALLQATKDRNNNFNVIINLGCSRYYSVGDKGFRENVEKFL